MEKQYSVHGMKLPTGFQLIGQVVSGMHAHTCTHTHKHMHAHTQTVVYFIFWQLYSNKSVLFQGLSDYLKCLDYFSGKETNDKHPVLFTKRVYARFVCQSV